MTRFMNSLDVSTRAETSAQGVLVGTVTSMPAASNYNVGCTVLYMGASGTYDTGCFYTCTQSGAGYTWEKAELVSQDLEVGTGNRALVSDASGRVTASGISTTQLGYLSGVSSDIQAQLNGKVPTGRTINGHALTGNVTLKISDLENDSGFITNTVSNLSNYYTKTQTYTKTEVDSRLDAINSMNVSVVSALPQTGDPHTIYLVPKSASGSDAHQEYLYVSGKWELIGDTSVDLSNYYTKAEVNSRDVSSASWSSNALRIYHTNGTYDSAAPSGAVSTVMTSNLSANRVVVTNTSGKLTSSSTITSTELGYLNNVKSNIQDQLDDKVPTNRTINGHALTSNITLTQSDLGIDIPEISVTANRAVISDSTGALTASAVTSTQLGYLRNVTSDVQSQLNGKQATVTGGASSILTSNLTESRVLVSDTSGKVSVSPVTTTQLGYLSGVTSAIQTQLNGKADADTEITGGTLSVSGSGTDSLQITLTLNNGVEITSNTFSRMQRYSTYLGYYLQYSDGLSTSRPGGASYLYDDETQWESYSFEDKMYNATGYDGKQIGLVESEVPGVTLDARGGSPAWTNVTTMDRSELTTSYSYRRRIGDISSVFKKNYASSGRYFFILLHPVAASYDFLEDVESFTCSSRIFFRISSVGSSSIAPTTYSTTVTTTHHPEPRESGDSYSIHTDSYSVSPITAYAYSTVNAGNTAFIHITNVSQVKLIDVTYK